MREPFYVYLCHPITGLPSEYLANVAAISAFSCELMMNGFCPINPAADLLEGLMSQEPLPIESYHRRAMELLGLLRGQSRAALYVMRRKRLDGSLASGVTEEIEQAIKWAIPVVCTRTELEQMRRAGT